MNSKIVISHTKNRYPSYFGKLHVSFEGYSIFTGRPLTLSALCFKVTYLGVAMISMRQSANQTNLGEIPKVFDMVI
jgi:hypothetical protein